MTERPRRLLCALAWLIALTLPLAVLAGILIPWADQLASLDRRIATATDQLTRYRRLIQTLPQLRAELERVRGNDRYKEFYFSAPTPALAGAKLQGQVQEIVTSAQGRLVSTQLLPEEQNQEPPRVRVRTQIQGTTEVLLEVLYRIEQARPFLFVEQLGVRSAARPQTAMRPTPGRPLRRMPTNPAGELTMRLDIQGYALDGGKP